MRRLKFGLGAAALAGAAAAANFILSGQAEKHDAAAAVSGPAAAVLPVPIAPVVKRTIPIYLDYSARTESIGNVTLVAKASGYVQAQPAPDGADVREGELL